MSIKTLLFLFYILAPGMACSQVVISNGTDLGSAGSPDVVIQTSSHFNNGSSYNFSGTQLQLILIGTNQTISGAILPASVHLNTSGNQTINGDVQTSRLLVNGGGTKVINGNVTVTQELHLTSGILQTGTGKILYTGASEGILNASESSYVNGIFHNKSDGLLTFPVGAPGVGYTPVQLENGNASEEIGITVINENPNLISGSDAELVYIDNTRYWQISGNLGAFTSRIILPYAPLSDSELSPVVVGADAPGATAINLGNFTNSETSVTSQNVVNKNLVTIGGSTSVDIKIHDLISPFSKDGKNDELSISNIGNFPSNKVTLLDRYGVIIKEWTNFTNFDDPFEPNTDTFNFATLSPGNYICVVEYGKEGQSRRKKSQMITVLKVK